MIKGVEYDGPTVSADKRVSAMADSYLRTGNAAEGELVNVDKLGHGRVGKKGGCKRRAIRAGEVDPWCELDFSLLSLLKLHVPDEYKLSEGELVMYCYKDKELVAVVAPKTVGEDCEV